MNRNRMLDLWVGLFVIIGIGALAFLALRAANASNFSSEPTYTLEARFDNIGSLKVRAPVRSAGVMVGRVSAIGFDAETYEAVVSFNISARYPFPKDTSAKILTAGLLGEQYLGLTAGGDAVMFKAGDTVRLTQSAVVLENLIGQFLYNKAAEGKPADAKPADASPGEGKSAGEKADDAKVTDSKAAESKTTDSTAKGGKTRAAKGAEGSQ